MKPSLAFAFALALGGSVFACAANTEPSASSAQDITESSSPTKVVDTEVGKVVANADGLSLYTFDPDTTSESTCYDGCARAWPPLVVSDTTTVASPFGTTTRRDGAKQLTLNGDPLYLYVGDSAQGDVTGDGIGGVWHLARP